MAQSNYNIPNDSAPAVRAQLNSVFQSIATNNSGTAAPSTTFPHQWWYDTTTNILKQRNAADSAWIDIGTFDQTGGTFSPAGVAQLTQGEAENPASTVFGQVSGQRLAQAVTAVNAGGQFNGVGTYALGAINTNDLVTRGSTYAGSSIQLLTGASGPKATEIFGNNFISGGLSGTWRAMQSTQDTSTGFGSTTLFLRIS
jgi:hypothetical protein